MNVQPLFDDTERQAIAERHALRQRETARLRRMASREADDSERSVMGTPAAITFIAAGLIAGAVAFPVFKFAAQTIVAASHAIQQLRVEE